MDASFKTINGTSYHIKTPDGVVQVLEAARLNRTRLHVSLGDPKAGLDWLEEWDTRGYVGRSMGPIKVPLLVPNSRSMGGGAILDHCIVRIRESAGGKVLYQHQKYHHGTVMAVPKPEPLNLPDGRVQAVDVLRDGQVHASFETFDQARRWMRKMGLKSEEVSHA